MDDAGNIVMRGVINVLPEPEQVDGLRMSLTVGGFEAEYNTSALADNSTLSDNTTLSRRKRCR